MSELLNDRVLHEALSAVFAVPEASEKLGWWLASGFSIERWVQFEFAFALEKRLGQKFAVGCESKWIDITIYESQPIPRTGLWTKESVAEIELKVRGNWFTGNPSYTFGGIADDILKVKKRPCPATALTVWFLGHPDPTIPRLAWFHDQVNRGEGVSTLDELLVKLQKWEVKIIQIGMPIVLTIPGFKEFSVYLFGFKNDKAETA